MNGGGREQSGGAGHALNGRLHMWRLDGYNTVRLHSALGYVAPKDRLEGRHTEIYAARDRKLEAAREKRRQRRANLEFTL